VYTASKNRLTLLEAIAQAYVFFAAGFETSSTTATFCLYELAQHQDLQDKLRNEIDEILKNHGELTYNAVNEMTYLHKVINGKLIIYIVKSSESFLSRFLYKQITKSIYNWEFAHTCTLIPYSTEHCSNIAAIFCAMFCTVWDVSYIYK